MRKNVNVPRVPPALVAGVAALAQVPMVRRSKSSGASLVTAGLLAGASVWILEASARNFRRERTTVNPFDVDRAASLVEYGPYRISRNPMYVGMAGLLLAHAVARRSWAAVVPVAVYVGAMNHAQIPREESALRQNFGVAFDDYARRVPRWLGLRSVEFRGGLPSGGDT